MALPVSQLRELVQPLVTDSPEAFLLVDDSVQDTRYSHFIDLTKRQYSGNVHGMVRGIGLVKLVIFCPWITAFTLLTRTRKRRMTTFWTSSTP